MSFTLTFALQLRKKQGKPSVRVAGIHRRGKSSGGYSGVTWGWGAKGADDPSNIFLPKIFFLATELERKMKKKGGSSGGKGCMYTKD